MKSEWNVIELGLLCERLSSGKNIKSSKINDYSQYPVYGGNGLRGYTEINNFEGECALIGRQGAFCGNVKYFKGKAYITEHAIVSIANKNNCTRFLYYILSTMNLGRLSGQSAQPGLSVKTLFHQPILIPDLITQRRIASVLSSLDDKIELNNKINENLQHQSQALFKSWFVDFEPWGGIMPEGWREGTLSDICSYGKKKITTKDLELHSYYSTENILPDKHGAFTASGFPSVDSVTRCSIGDTLVSNIRPYFKKIMYCSHESGCSNDVLCLHPVTDAYSTYVYALTYCDDFFDYMMAGAKGTKMPRGDKQQIMRYPVCVPDDHTLDKFVAISSQIRKLIDNNTEQNHRLAQLRDTLLPKLMSGELDVSDVELGLEES